VSPARLPRVPALRYRPARRTDVETLAELGVRTWRVSSLEKRREFYTDHPRFGLRDVRVGELDGQVVCSLVLYPLSGFVRGQPIPLTGVGSVSVAPEQRRRGIGEALMRAALRELRQRGSALSILYAFRGSYYRKLGYGTIEIVHPLAFSPSNLPASDEARRTRRLMLPDRPAVQALYDRVAAQGHFAIARTREWWNLRLWGYPGDWVVYEGRRRGQIEGYLYYEIDSTHGPFRLAMTLVEFVAATPEAHRGLIGHLASLSDQVQEIHFASPGDHGWLALLKTAQNLRPGAEIGLVADTGNVANGAMLRLTEVKQAIEGLPASPAARGEIVLEVEDSVLPQNARAYRVSARDGRLKVRPEASRSGVRPRLPRREARAEYLGPLIAGTLSPTRAAELGLIGSSGGAAETIEHWFRARPVYLHQLNAF
jgi:predicted acetyltransferase